MITKNLENLIEVYKKTVEDENLFINSRSIHWQKRYQKKEKFLELDHIINFRNNQILSTGLDDGTNLIPKIYLMELLNEFSSDFLKRTLPKKNVGNCNNSSNLLDYYIDYGIVHHLYHYSIIEKYIKNNTKICEIGGGFGSLARVILKNHNVKYFLIDLPEANLQANYYLQNNLPEKRVFNYIDYKNKKIGNEIQNYEIFILPPHVINDSKMKEILFDFFINSRSFMEMTSESIKNYFYFIQNKSTRNSFFLNINSLKKSVVGEDIRICDYPYDESWKVIISKESFLQKNMQFLLTERVEDPEKKNIKEELKKIRNYKVHYTFKYTGIFYKFFNKKLWLIISIMLKFFIGSKKLKKIANILYNMSIK